MGLPIRKLFATNIDTDIVSDLILISSWIPEKRDNGKYYRPDNTPLGFEMLVPNVLNLSQSDGTIQVNIEKSEEETGIWLFCYDDYFGNEQHLFTFKHRFIPGTKDRIDWAYAENLLDDAEDKGVDIGDIYGIHVYCPDIEMKAGDGPISVTLTRI